MPSPAGAGVTGMSDGGPPTRGESRDTASRKCSICTLAYIPEEVVGPDLQEMRNIHARLKPTSWVASDWGRGDR